MNSKVVRCIVDLYLFRLLGIAICCSRVYHTSGRYIETLDVIKVVMKCSKS